MLSILIPVYNYNVFSLVLKLKRQADNLGIIYEILAQDDLSQKFNNENAQINTLENCIFSINPENLGRGRNINLLCSKSKYNYILIMEADALPENESYLKNYIELLSKKPKVIFGGVKYPDAIPSKEKILRWKYGIQRETKSLNQRLQNHYNFVFTWNLLLKKEILLQFPFPEFIRDYGYEDLIFIENLRLNSVPVIHIENFLIHYNNEDSINFIEKTERAVRNLYNLIQLHKIDPKGIKLTKAYVLLKKLHLIGFIKAIYKITKNKVLANLTSENPNLYLLDFYKLCYYCHLKK
ncbi:glycosyl transferase family 2 [Flavobacterium sp. WLB]|uniref:glycosyltransferase n=1 Tax=unclassified Flavobacterium TaxID=196869 RepID=UPI0006AB903D|nr:MULTISPECIES: glycosyltransferase [unclassified Flavobacterium]KOP39071.1 glycosyl transferase family 2 [Flavobacterium sp. VMW]OWU89273.1 glycosyl transferase family 2 [Flavobacterium sp. NLM]PUU69207.1 glycosyl transferase family 2 [Flavobacterium sp. WLB]